MPKHTIRLDSRELESVLKVAFSLQYGRDVSVNILSRITKTCDDELRPDYFERVVIEGAEVTFNE